MLWNTWDFAFVSDESLEEARFLAMSAVKNGSSSAIQLD